MKLVFSTLLLFVIFLSATSQNKTHTISLEPDISLSQSFYVSNIIDARLNKENIGVAQKGISNKQVPVEFVNEFEDHLTKTLQVLLPQSDLRKPFILSVKNLFVSERTSAFSELAKCEITFEFLQQRDSLYYSYGEFSSLKEGKGADVTSKHKDHILFCIKECIIKFSTSGWEKSTGKEIANPYSPLIETTFSKNSQLKPGLYMNFNDLMNNTPIDSVEYEIITLAQNNKLDRHQILDLSTGKRIKNLFGFTDGESIYLNASRFTVGEYFVKSKLLGRYIYFEDQTNSTSAAVAFGAIGALASIKHVGIVLDTKTGLTKILNEKNTKYILKSEPILLAAYEHSPKTTELLKEIISSLNDKNE